MSVLEQIARLNAKAQDYELLPPGYVRITMADIAQALGLLRGNGPKLLARVAYANQYDLTDNLAQELCQNLTTLAKAKRWRNTGPLLAMSRLAVTLHTRPLRCTRCQGRGKRMRLNKVIECPRCHGSTWDSHSDASMARAIEVSPAAWNETWSDRYDQALIVLSIWDRRCICRLKRLLR